jgi:ubiquinone/menaquinone biosynthesis C-methylase UbiE
MKDIFSKQSHLYAQFRPTYPKELFDFLLSLVQERTAAWDCGTGSGQVANQLATYFTEVFATDISENQINNAIKKENIHYKIESAEHTSFEDTIFDLITVAQAIHWFDFDKFYKEVDRTLKSKGIIAIIGYTLPRIDKQIDTIIDNFYDNVIGAYWDAERRYVDELYQTIPFPYNEIKAPTLSTTYEWNFEQLIGFINTWSAVQHYIDRNIENPVGKITNELKSCWGKGVTKTATFPILLRVGGKF